MASHSGVISEANLEDWLDKNLFSNDALDRRGGGGGSSDENGGATKKKEVSERVGEGDEAGTAAKRGFISFASQYGRDDYAL